MVPETKESARYIIERDKMFHSTHGTIYVLTCNITVSMVVVVSIIYLPLSFVSGTISGMYLYYS